MKGDKFESLGLSLIRIVYLNIPRGSGNKVFSTGMDPGMR
jgi:hypothetical protein